MSSKISDVHLSALLSELEGHGLKRFGGSLAGDQCVYQALRCFDSDIDLPSDVGDAIMARFDSLPASKWDPPVRYAHIATAAQKVKWAPEDLLQFVHDVAGAR